MEEHNNAKGNSHGTNACAVISLAIMTLSPTRANYHELENNLKLQLVRA